MSYFLYHWHCPPLLSSLLPFLLLIVVKIFITAFVILFPYWTMITMIHTPNWHMSYTSTSTGQWGFDCSIRAPDHDDNVMTIRASSSRSWRRRYSHDTTGDRRREFDCCISGKAAVARPDTHEHDDNDVIKMHQGQRRRVSASASALVSAVMVDAECWVWVGGSTLRRRRATSRCRRATTYCIHNHSWLKQHRYRETSCSKHWRWVW